VVCDGQGDVHGYLRPAWGIDPQDPEGDAGRHSTRKLRDLTTLLDEAGTVPELVAHTRACPRTHVPPALRTRAGAVPLASAASRRSVLSSSASPLPPD
jgi:hypothetical protein